MSRVFHVRAGTAASQASRARPTPSSPTGTGLPSACGSTAPGGSAQGGIVAGYLAPHPPHLIYAENPAQNEPRSRGGWETLRWGYEELRRRMSGPNRPDVLVVHAPHWITMVGHHVNCVPNPRGISVEPIFPNLFRYHYDFRTDVELAESILAEADGLGLVTSAMREPDVRVDYATIGALHLVNPAWDLPVVSISANNNPYYYGDAPLEEMEALGRATRRAIAATGRRAVLCASNSLSHLHWDVEPEVPEDMAREHPYNDHQYRWDMKLLDVMRAGRGEALRRFIPEHIEATAAETKSGGLSWMLSALGWPDVPGRVHAYGTVIGTGNAVVEWDVRGVQS